jgi:hypothetical protein
MKNWLAKILPFLLVVAGVALAPLSNWCIDSLRTCYGTWIHQNFRYFIQPLYDFSVPILFIAVVVIFIPWAIFKSWLKFVAWFLPLCFIFIAITPVSATRMGIDLFPYYRINAAHDAGLAFVVLSLLLIGWKMYRQKRGA